MKVFIDRIQTNHATENIMILIREKESRLLPKDSCEEYWAVYDWSCKSF